jgi:hypothetical protein
MISDIRGYRERVGYCPQEPATFEHLTGKNRVGGYLMQSRWISYASFRKSKILNAMEPYRSLIDPFTNN